jgi:NAD(P)-dependent dehydrogenase (short-subunit alcohol dehydrogenase family)
VSSPRTWRSTKLDAGAPCRQTTGSRRLLAEKAADHDGDEPAPGGATDSHDVAPGHESAGPAPAIRVPCALARRPAVVAFADEHVGVPAGGGERRAAERARHPGLADDDRAVAVAPGDALHELHAVELDEPVAQRGEERRPVGDAAAQLNVWTMSLGRAVHYAPVARLGLASMPPITGKAAAHSLTQALRPILAARGIAVHGVHPGGSDTDMLAGIDAPKSPPGAVGARLPDGLAADEEDIFPTRRPRRWPRCGAPTPGASSVRSQAPRPRDRGPGRPGVEMFRAGGVLTETRDALPETD